MNDVFGDAYLHPTARRNLKLLRDVKWKEDRNDLNDFDEHLTRAYILQTKMEYEQLQKFCSECKEENFELEFLQKLVNPNEELKEIMTSRMLKKSEQFETAQMLLHNNTLSGGGLISYLIKNTNVVNAVNEKMEHASDKSFYSISGISSSNKLGQFFKQEFELENKIQKSIGRVK